MAYGLFGYAIDLEHMNAALGSGDETLTQTLLDRFAEPIGLNERWYEAHSGDQDILPLKQAIQKIVSAPPDSFDNRDANIGYALEILAYHLGEPIRIGRGGRSALRDITLAEITEILEAASVHTGPTPLDGGDSLPKGLLLRAVGNIENQAAYPGTGFLRRNEIARISKDLMSSRIPGAPAQQPWYPLTKLMAGALDQGLDLITFYY